MRSRDWNLNASEANVYVFAVAMPQHSVQDKQSSLELSFGRKICSYEYLSLNAHCFLRAWFSRSVFGKEDRLGVLDKWIREENDLVKSKIAPIMVVKRYKKSASN